MGRFNSNEGRGWRSWLVKMTSLKVIIAGGRQFKRIVPCSLISSRQGEGWLCLLMMAIRVGGDHEILLRNLIGKGHD
jgi:hypothetical protein